MKTKTAARRYPKSLREARGDRSQQWVAEQVGVNHSTVCHWENGFCVPRKPTMRQIALTFDVPFEVVERWFAAAQAEAA